MSTSKKFIDHLHKLADDGEGDRAPLAALRRGASGEPRDLAAAYPHVLPLAPKKNLIAQQAYIDTACLFGRHPTKSRDRTRSLSLASAMRRLKSKSDSIDTRFVAMLRSHPDELLGHVRHCVDLAKSNEFPLRWDDVLRALLYWNEDAPTREGQPRSPQRRWAQDFWGPEDPESNESLTASE